MKMLLRNLGLVFVTASACSWLGIAHSDDFIPPPLSESRVINERIDVDAQRSIVRLSKGTAEERFIARFLLRGVDSGALGGIYQVNRGVPALRAQALGKGWWTLLQGRPSMCWKEPAGERPLIIYGTSVPAQPAVLDAALVAAFRECGLRRLDIVIRKNVGGGRVMCNEATAVLTGQGLGVMVDNPPCITVPQSGGTCRLALPPDMYGFRVTCDGASTDPAEIFRAVAPGQGVQVEAFNF